MPDINIRFCQRLLAMTFAEVKTVIPQARANDAGAVSGCTGWFVELPDRPY